ncbi:hypothetical protein ACFWU3_10370 [Streptomyces sp. NPDC058685]|uniref:hypothetical protein n=1 Tax=Streptomyces sp. NPDC058685 TaxID=3346598 RepID=UPI003669513A
MAVHQVPAQTGVFARYLKGLAALLDRDGGWYAVFLHRDPQGMQACLDGFEVPPWDVVGSLLQDLAVVRGREFVEQEQLRAKQLHTASAAAHDRRPGGREALVERLELMRRELIHATGRNEELIRLIAAEPEGTQAAQQLTYELEWVRDDHVRATARVAELRRRLAVLPPPEHGRAGAPGPGERVPRQASRPESAQWSAPAQEGPRTAPQAETPASGDQGRGSKDGGKAGARDKRRRPRGARFAGMEEDVEAVAVPELPVGGDLPRGARYGAAGTAPEQEQPVLVDPEDALRAAHETVRSLGRLRAEGRSGEAHALLCEAATLPAGRLPVLAAELHRAGLEADWATLLWEAASQPVLRLAAIAGALSAAGRAQDGHQLLRQGVTRPADEIAAAVLSLDEDGRAPEALALLVAYAQLHTPADTARIADRDPARLVPRLLAAARAGTAAHERDLVHALRVSGHLGA